ncbi:hypothetical protein [Acinetobacter bereziniae]|uniref:hypothetical protein n=1 Tax=Acinetobacter bereziniae TaxID=106648 RepID=UPI0006666955|nr:hypothetical protein [Acinetobacter bereziniae]
MLTVYEIRKKNVESMIEYSSSRRAFAQKIGIEYNLLNQYMSKRNPKNIGDKLALKITAAHQLPEGWLDHEHDQSAIKNMVNSQSTSNDDVKNTINTDLLENHPSANQNFAVKSIPILNFLRTNKGEELEVSKDVIETANVYVPPSIINPIAYQIRGTGYGKPYRNGYVVVCEFKGEPISGEDVLIFCKDGTIYAGEFLYQQDILISINSIDGEKDEILKENIDRISPVKLFISQSQINK